MVNFSVNSIVVLILIAALYRIHLGGELRKLHTEYFTKANNMFSAKNPMEHILIIHFSSENLKDVEEVLCKESTHELIVIFIGPQWMFNLKEKLWNKHSLIHIPWNSEDTDFVGLSKFLVKKDSGNVVSYNDAVSYRNLNYTN